MPNTIAQNLARLQTARTAIANAITAKGGTVNNGDGFEQFPADIASIPSGGGNLDEALKSAKPRLISSGAHFYYGWKSKTWRGFTSLNGHNIWTDGTDIYYSSGSAQYVLDKATSTWTAKTWSGLTSFSGKNVWTDGTDIFCTGGSNPNVYALEKDTSTWAKISSSNFGYMTDVWTDGTDIYYNVSNTSESYSYVMSKVPASTVTIPTVRCLPTYTQ